MKTFSYQREIHRSTERFLVVDGGRRIGKSVLGGREAFAQLCIPGSWVWIVGPTMDLAEKEFRIVWHKAVDEKWIPVLRKSERELFIKFANGSYLECRSEENPDQLIGEGLDLMVIAEAARLKFRTWDQLLKPALADRQGRAIFTSTPRGFNWFEELYRIGQDPDEKSWKSWMIPSRMNPILPQSEIEEARRTSTPEAFAQEWEAKFIHYAGLVFPEFDENVHVRHLPFNPQLPTALWVDPGSTAPYAVLLIQYTPDEQVFVLDEIYRTGRVTDQIINEAEEKWGPFILDTETGAPKNEVIVTIDEAAAEAAAVWRQRGYRAGGKKPKVRQGIEVHHRFLRDPYRSRLPQTYGPEDPGEVVPRILFSPRCKNTIKEHGQYHYPDDTRKKIETNKSELPVDIDNHTIDAIRYGYRNTWPEMFNDSPESETIIRSSVEQLFGLSTSEMQIEDSYSQGGVFKIEDSYSETGEERFRLT